MKYFVGLCFLTCSVVPSFGTTINFATPTGDQGTTQTYGVITATLTVPVRRICTVRTIAVTKRAWVSPLIRTTKSLPITISSWM